MCAVSVQDSTISAELAVARIESLAGTPLTPKIESEGLELLKELGPGPYSTFALEHLVDVAKIEVPLRSQWL